MAATTSGGLVKHSVQFTPDELAWCRAQSDAQGRCGVSAVVRKAIDAAMGADQAASTGTRGGVR